MKAATGAIVAAIVPLGSALVIPDVPIDSLNPFNDDGPTWFDYFESQRSLDERLESSKAQVVVDKGVDFIHVVEHKASEFVDEFSDLFGWSSDDDDDEEREPHHPPPGHEPHHPPGHHDPHHDTEKYTIWELLQKTDKTKTFRELVGEYPSLVDLLNSTEANYTLFVPGESAFEKIPDHHKKPSKEEIEEFLKYHIVEGNWNAGKLWHHNTVPTLREEKLLGDEKQRLRIGSGLRGLTINAYAHVIMGNIAAKNGYIHAIDNVIIPPFLVGKTLSLFPQYFGTLLHAYEKTDFVKFIHGVPMEGSTVFAPTNRAWAKLGPRVNAYLFNTERGQKILTAILKYGIVANTTLYTDAVYGKLDAEDDVQAQGGQTVHYELKTLYDDKSIGVDIWRWGPLTSVKVNGWNSVSFADGVSKNGVIHFVSSVPLPPCPRHEGDESVFGDEVTIASLEERFQEYLDQTDDEEWELVDAELDEDVNLDL